MKKLLLPILQALIFVISTTLFTGCSSLNDAITLAPDGTFEFNSEIVITDETLSLDDVNKISAEFVKSLSDAGWTVGREVTASEPPYRLLFKGRGNLDSIRSVADLYDLTQINENEFRIRFKTLEVKDAEDGHLDLSKADLRTDARVTDSDGNQLNHISQLSEQQTYTLHIK